MMKKLSSNSSLQKHNSAFKDIHAKSFKQRLFATILQQKIKESHQFTPDSNSKKLTENHRPNQKEHSKLIKYSFTSRKSNKTFSPVITSRKPTLVRLIRDNSQSGLSQKIQRKLIQQSNQFSIKKLLSLKNLWTQNFQTLISCYIAILKPYNNIQINSHFNQFQHFNQLLQYPGNIIKTLRNFPSMIKSTQLTEKEIKSINKKFRDLKLKDFQSLEAAFQFSKILVLAKKLIDNLRSQGYDFSVKNHQKSRPKTPIIRSETPDLTVKANALTPRFNQYQIDDDFVYDTLTSSRSTTTMATDYPQSFRSSVLQNALEKNLRTETQESYELCTIADISQAFRSHTPSFDNIVDLKMISNQKKIAWQEERVKKATGNFMYAQQDRAEQDFQQSLFMNFKKNNDRQLAESLIEKRVEKQGEIREMRRLKALKEQEQRKIIQDQIQRNKVKSMLLHGTKETEKKILRNDTNTIVNCRNEDIIFRNSVRRYLPDSLRPQMESVLKENKRVKRII